MSKTTSPYTLCNGAIVVDLNGAKHTFYSNHEAYQILLGLAAQDNLTEEKIREIIDDLYVNYAIKKLGQ